MRVTRKTSSSSSSFSSVLSTRVRHSVRCKRLLTPPIREERVSYSSLPPASLPPFHPCHPHKITKDSFVKMSKTHQTKLPCLQSGKGAAEKSLQLLGNFVEIAREGRIFLGPWELAVNSGHK